MSRDLACLRRRIFHRHSLARSVRELGQWYLTPRKQGLLLSSSMSRRSFHAMWTRRCDRNRLPLTNDSCRVAERNCVIWYVPCHDRSRPYEGVFSDCYPWINDALCADRCEPLHSCLKEFPFTVGFRVFVVGECDVRSDEHVVFYSYSGWDEDEGSNFAVVAYCDAFFKIDESVYLGVLSDRAAVEIYLVIYAG